MAGYVKMPKDFCRSVVGSRGLLYQGALYWLAANAAYSDTGDEGISLKRGQIAVTRRDLARKWDIGEMKLRCLLDKLEQAGYIRKETSRQYTIITVCDYDKYQGGAIEVKPTDIPPSSHNDPTDIPPISLNKELKNNKNNILPLAQASAREDVPVELTPEEAREWERWMVLYENEFGKPMHQLQREQQLAKLILLPAEFRLEALRNSCGFNGKVKPAIYDPRPPVEAVRRFQPADQRQAAPLSLEEQEKLAEGFIE